jgi:hypothetical protein
MALKWNFCIFNDLLEYLRPFGISYGLFGIVCGHLVCLSLFLVCLDQEKSGNPGRIVGKDERDRRTRFLTASQVFLKMDKNKCGKKLSLCFAMDILIHCPKDA